MHISPYFKNESGALHCALREMMEYGQSTREADVLLNLFEAFCTKCECESMKVLLFFYV